MRNLNEAEIKEILRNREQKIAGIHKKMFSMYQELQDTDGLMKSLALPSTALHGMPGGKGSHKDLGNVLLQYNSRLYTRNEEIRQLMWELVEQEESICQLWLCFQKLKHPYYAILHELYVENQLYQTVEDGFGKSHKTFEKYRKKGMEQLMQSYHDWIVINERELSG